MARPKQPRNHNEWFRPVTSKTTCPCGAKRTQVYSWGEYVTGKWRTVTHFCAACFPSRVQAPLREHAGPCGCTISLVWYRDAIRVHKPGPSFVGPPKPWHGPEDYTRITRPPWLTLD